MNKADMIDRIATASGITKAQAGTAVEAGIAAIFLGPRDVDLFVGGVDVATEDDRMPLRDALVEEIDEGVVEVVLEGEPFRAGWKIPFRSHARRNRNGAD